MGVNDLVLARGMHDTRAALRSWKQRPAAVVGRWFAVSFLIALALLAAVYVVARASRPDPTAILLPGLNAPATASDYTFLLYRNGLVLALHAMACVAGFMAGSSLPLSASQRTGPSRWIHEKAGPLAVAFVAGATLFSLATQAYALGGAASTLAAQLDVSRAVLLAGLLPHALPELVGLFLPLAAWLVASRRGEWHELLAATIVTVAIAVPLVLASAAVELWVSPHLLRALA